MSSTDSTETKASNVATPLSETLKSRVKAMQTEFYNTLQRAKHLEQKTIDNTDNASEYFFDQVNIFEKNYFNKVTPLDDWREQELQKLKKALIDSKQEIINSFEALYKRSSEATLTYELDLVLDELENTLNNYKYWVREKIDTPLTHSNTDTYLYHEPVGLVLIIGEWQSPLYSLLKPAINAIAAGNHVVLYGAPETKKITETLSNILTKNADQNRIQVIGDATSTEQLLELPVDFVYASGTADQCKDIYRIAGEKGIPVALNKRGLNIAVVHKTADLNAAAERIVLGRFINAGQYNATPDHVYVHESLFTDFLVKAKIHVYCNYANPEKNRDFVRLITPEHVNQVLDVTAKGSHNGQLETRINFDREGNLVEPIIITNPNEKSKLVTEPVRGPVLTLIKFKEIDEIIEKVQGNKNVENVYYFVNNSEHQSKFISKVSNTNVFINQAGVQGFNFNLPVGSVGGIYNAKIGGAYGVRTFSNSRVVVEGQGLRQYKSLIPPFTGERYKTLHRFDLLKKFTVRQGRLATAGAGALLAYWMFK